MPLLELIILQVGLSERLVNKMLRKKFNRSGIAIDFGASKISISEIVKGKFKKNLTKITKIDKKNKNYIYQIIKNIDEISTTKPKKIGIAITGRVDKLGNWYPVNKNSLGIFKLPLKK